MKRSRERKRWRREAEKQRGNVERWVRERN